MSVAKRECPSCAAEVPVDHGVCDICGYEFSAGGTYRSWVKWAALTVILVFAVLFAAQLVRMLRQ